MDFYTLHHNIRNLNALVEKYPQGKEMKETLDELAKQISTRKYRVAVIGEFKRGKSSLVNCLLGTEILPTDILPTTAVINRIVYDTEQKIDIYYKDGRTEVSSIDSLSEYATKLDAEKEKFAETIKEIIVHYPSVFGQNNIELLDTPGLNDNERMTETTFEVLDKIDTALVVISAQEPLSITEQNLICTLIEQKDIYHLTFVVTFIDRVSDDAEEQDRLVDTVKKRLQNNAYELFAKNHDDPELLAKAERILKSPAVFAVSSKQAMQGFIKGDNALIKKSRFSHFKLQLTALLTANQEKDIVFKSKRLGQETSATYKSWHEEKLNDMYLSLEDENNKLNLALEYLNFEQTNLINRIKITDDALNNIPIFADPQNLSVSVDMPAVLRKIFIKHLSSQKRENYSADSLNKTIDSAVKEAESSAEHFGAAYKERALSGINLIQSKAEEACKSAYIDASSVKKLFDEQNRSTDFPTFRINGSFIKEKTLSGGEECILAAYDQILAALEIYSQNVTDYMDSQRAFLFKCSNITLDEAKKNIEMHQKNIKTLNQNISNEKSAYPDNQSKVDEITRNILNTL